MPGLLPTPISLPTHTVSKTASQAKAYEEICCNQTFTQDQLWRCTSVEFRIKLITHYLETVVSKIGSNFCLLKAFDPLHKTYRPNIDGKEIQIPWETVVKTYINSNPKSVS